MTREWDFDKDTVQGSMTLYAKWVDASQLPSQGFHMPLWGWLALGAVLLAVLLLLLLRRKTVKFETFGGTALFFNLAFKGAALATLAAHGSWELLLTACALAGLLARSQIFIAMRFPGARPGGMGEAFKQGTRPGHALAAAAVTLAACALAGWNGLYALLSALAGSMGLLLYARRRLGGVTGDVFGCTVECTEWLVLLTFCTL